MTRFRDRRAAGVELATHLTHLRVGPPGSVLALPRGGVPVGFEVARALGWPLDVFVVRKLGAPGHEEYAVGAIATGGVRVLNEVEVRYLGIGPETLRDIEEREQRELERRERAYRAGRPPLVLEGRVAVLVDDGLATGASMRAAVEAARHLAPSRLVVAVPVGAPDTCRSLASVADEVVCAYQPEPFMAVGLWYEDFRQTSDREVHELLALASRPGGEEDQT